jgi:transposase
MEITDNLTGEIIPAYIFVATLNYSGYAYVEAFLSRNQENWIAAHVNAYRFFGGATRILTPDNLKTGAPGGGRNRQKPTGFWRKRSKPAASSFFGVFACSLGYQPKNERAKGFATRNGASSGQSA